MTVLRNGVASSLTIDHDQRVQSRVLAGDLVETRTKLGIGDRNGGSGIRQIKLQEIRRRQRIDQQRHKAGAHRAEKRRRIGRRIVEKHQDAIAALESQRDQAMAPARGLSAEFGIAHGAKRTGQRQAIAVSFVDVIEENAARIVNARNREADLARAGAVDRNLIGDLKRSGRTHGLPPPTELGCDAS